MSEINQGSPRQSRQFCSSLQDGSSSLCISSSSPAFQDKFRSQSTCDSFLGGAQASIKKRIGLNESYKWIANPAGSFKFEKRGRWIAWLFSGVWSGAPPKSSCFLRYFLSLVKVQTREHPRSKFALPAGWLVCPGLGLLRLSSFGHFLH